MDDMIYFHLKLIKNIANIKALEEQAAVLEINRSVLDKLTQAAQYLELAKDELVSIENGTYDQ